ncbi:MAG: 5-methyltetrahydropteroyltriglutamate--homocysteine methyltransferase [Gammaproteobacteria bacterium]|jgi:5-methyltetrahydropteroyltriglutamate--homocysteine methyltransferase
MYRSEQRILTSHVGSLPRPSNILEWVYAHQKGTPFDDAYWTTVEEAVVDVVGQQIECGIDIVDDGELGKVGFTNYLCDRLEGLGGETEMWSFHDLDEVPEVAERQYASESGQHINMPACIGAIRYVGFNEIQRDLEILRRAVDQHGTQRAFVPAVSPGAVVFQIVNRYYPSYEDYLMSVAEAMRSEYEAIAAAGFMLQIDSPDLAMSSPAHSRFWATDKVKALGHRGFIELHLEALNLATANIPPDQLRLHLCWANYEGPHHHDAGLIDVLEPVLRLGRPRTISFEAANPRHEHEWQVFEDLKLPDDMVIMPGVIDSTTNFVEHPELVAQRIERYAQLVGRERVIAGTDCGFATYAGFGEVHPRAAWLKLSSLGEGAAIASKRLWQA